MDEGFEKIIKQMERKYGAEFDIVTCLDAYITGHIYSIEKKGDDLTEAERQIVIASLKEKYELYCW